MRFLCLCSLLLALVFFQPFEGCAAELKVGFIYPSPVSDAGWSSSHDLGRKASASLPGVRTTFVESVPEGQFGETVLRKLAQDGCGLIFAASYGYGDSTLKVAREFPGAIFMHCSGNRRDKNVGTYFGRIHEAMYLTGIVAGSMTKSNRIGFVGAYPIGEVIRGINAFTLGARSVNPGAVVQVSWTNSWFDPPQEKKAALALIDAGADIIAQHQDSPACQLAAQERGKFSIGYNTDMSAFAPRAHLTSAVWNWAPLYEHIARQVQEGRWKSEDVTWGLDKGVVDIAPFGPMVPEEVRARVLAAREGVKSGTVRVFAGPIEDQEGKVRIPAGREARDADLQTMDWLVKGVSGKIE